LLKAKENAIEKLKAKKKEQSEAHKLYSEKPLDWLKQKSTKTLEDTNKL